MLVKLYDFVTVLTEVFGFLSLCLTRLHIRSDDALSASSLRGAKL